MGYSPRGCKESDTTERLTLLFGEVSPIASLSDEERKAPESWRTCPVSHSKEGVGLVSSSAPARLAWHPPLIYFQSAGFCSSLQSGWGCPQGPA